MATIKRASGITVEIDDRVDFAPQVQVRGRARAGAPRPNPEDALIVAVLRGQGMKLADAIPVPAVQSTRMRAGPHEGTVTRLAVPLSKDEQAVVLLEEEGEFRWVVPDNANEATRALPPIRNRGSYRPLPRQAHFSLTVSPQSGEDGLAQPRTRGFIGGKLMKGAIAYVLRFAVRVGGKVVLDRLEKDIAEGIVSIASVDPAGWKPVSNPAALVVPADREPRVLLMIHGTFSSTVGSFGALGVTANGKDFLSKAMAAYDLVLGFDHRTLSVDPLKNAKDLFAALRQIPAQRPPHIDVVAFSRGGLVARSFLEDLLPASGWRATLGPAVFVGCTNGGTLLAKADNWHRFADHYTNLALGALRVVSFVPGTAAWTAVAGGAIRGVGILVKALVSGLITDGVAPGLAAMEPGGSFVKRINETQPGQVTAGEARYFAVTSDFEPGRALAGGSSELPAKLLTRLTQEFIDATADSLYGEANDLVVHVRAMTQVDPSATEFFKGRHDYGQNGAVYHTNYFTREKTAEFLSQCLVSGAGAAAGRGRGPIAQRAGSKTNGTRATPAVEVRALQAGTAAASKDIAALLAGSPAGPLRPTKRKLSRKATAPRRRKVSPKRKGKIKSKRPSRHR